MSLKALHIVFVTACTLMCLMCGVWAGFRYLEFRDNPLYLVGAMSSFVLAVAMVVYGRYVLRKLKNLSYL